MTIISLGVRSVASSLIFQVYESRGMVTSRGKTRTLTLLRDLKTTLGSLAVTNKNAKIIEKTAF